MNLWCALLAESAEEEGLPPGLAIWMSLACVALCVVLTVLVLVYANRSMHRCWRGVFHIGTYEIEVLLNSFSAKLTIGGRLEDEFAGYRYQIVTLHGMADGEHVKVRAENKLRSAPIVRCWVGERELQLLSMEKRKK